MEEEVEWQKVQRPKGSHYGQSRQDPSAKSSNLFDKNGKPLGPAKIVGGSNREHLQEQLIQAGVNAGINVVACVAMQAVSTAIGAATRRSQAKKELEEEARLEELEELCEERREKRRRRSKNEDAVTPQQVYLVQTPAGPQQVYVAQAAAPQAPAKRKTPGRFKVLWLILAVLFAAGTIGGAFDPATRGETSLVAFLITGVAIAGVFFYLFLQAGRMQRKAAEREVAMAAEAAHGSPTAVPYGTPTPPQYGTPGIQWQDPAQLETWRASQLPPPPDPRGQATWNQMQDQPNPYGPSDRY